MLIAVLVWHIIVLILICKLLAIADENERNEGKWLTHS